MVHRFLLWLVVVGSIVYIDAKRSRGSKPKLISERRASELIKGAMKSYMDDNHGHLKPHRKETVMDSLDDNEDLESNQGRGEKSYARAMRCPAPCPQSCSLQGCTPGCCASNMPVAPCSQQPGGCGPIFMPYPMPMMPCAQPGGCSPPMQMAYPMPMPLPAPMPCSQPGGCMPQMPVQMPVQMPTPCLPPACMPGMGMAYMQAPPPPMQFSVQMGKPQIFQLPLPQAPLQMVAQTYQQSNCNPACAFSCQPSCPKTSCCGPLPSYLAPPSCPQQCAQSCAPQCPHSCCSGYQSQMAMPQPMMMPMPLQVQMLPPMITQLPQQACAPQCQLSCAPMCPRPCCGIGKRRR